MGERVHLPGKPGPLSNDGPPLLHNRWLIVTAAAVVMMTTGTLYSWAMFTQPLLVAFHWDVTTTTWAYAIANFCLAAIGAVMGGFWQDRVGPRRVAATGVTLWGVGNLAAGLGTIHWGAPWLYLTYGVVGGVGAGMAYIAPMCMVAKWFPDRRGVAGGMVAAGFGLGAFIYNQCVPRLAGFHAVARHAGAYLAANTTAAGNGKLFDAPTARAAAVLSPMDVATIMHVFIVSGCIYLVVGLIFVSLFRDPPDAHAVRPCVAAQDSKRGLRPSQVIRRPQFYLLWLQLFADAIAGITIISNAVYILHDLTQRPLGDLAPLFGLVSLCNAAGRILWGAVSDRIGCRQTFVAMFVIQAAVLFWLTDVHDLHLALVAFGVILLCCGGGFGTMPAYSAEYFGTRFMGLNYGLILSAWGFAGLVGPLLMARAKDITGSFAGMLPIVGSLLLLSVTLPLLTAKPRGRAIWDRPLNTADAHEFG